jgi:feruloyl esterase
MGRDQGEPLSIRQMVEKMILDHGIDRSRVFITGLSAGGAMTAVMLATYPEVFAGGAIIAGLPYGTACNFSEAFQSMLHGTEREAKTWGDLVRAASPHGGPWPKLSIWHGTSDGTVKSLNAGEIVKQWSDLHGVDHAAPLHDTVDNYPRRVWYGPLGDAILEEYELTGMDHGTPVDTNHVEAAGDAGPFFLDVGISSTYHIARFWGLFEKAAQKSAAEPDMVRPSVELVPEAVIEEVFLVSEAAPVVPELESMPVIELPPPATPRPLPVPLTPVALAPEPVSEAEFFAEAEEEIEDQNDEDRHSFFDLHGLLNKALKAAGLIKS